MEIWFTLCGWVLGSCLGSFAKALADRSLTKRTFSGRSYCSKCKQTLRWYDLFPVFSYLSTQGRCRYCHAKIGVEYFLVEVIAGIIIAYLFYQNFGNLTLQISNQFSVFNFQFLFFLSELGLKVFFVTILIPLFLTDIRKMLIPDRIIIPAIVISILSLAVLTVTKIGYLFWYLSHSAIGRYLLPPYNDYFIRHALMYVHNFMWNVVMGVGIAGFFLLLIIITRGKGMGGGDVKLGALIGIVLGFPSALVAILLSFLTGAVFSVGLILVGRKHFGQTIPFGPFLVLGSLIALFWGEQIVSWYLKLSF